MYDELVKRLRDNAEFLLKASSGCLSNSFADTMCQAADAIEELQKRVPKRPHGRLGDLDEIERYKERLVVDADKIKKGIRYVVDTKYIKEAPTIIPAEEGE